MCLGEIEKLVQFDIQTAKEIREVLGSARSHAIHNLRFVELRCRSALSVARDSGATSSSALQIGGQVKREGQGHLKCASNIVQRK